VSCERDRKRLVAQRSREDPILARHRSTLKSLGADLDALTHLSDLWSKLAGELDSAEASVEIDRPRTPLRPGRRRGLQPEEWTRPIESESEKNLAALRLVNDPTIIVAIRLPCRRCSPNGFTRSLERHTEGR
jgi:hypothetical protein